jgi:hypothetical protein
MSCCKNIKLKNVGKILYKLNKKWEEEVTRSVQSVVEMREEKLQICT